MDEHQQENYDAMWAALQAPLPPEFISIKNERRGGKDLEMPYIDYTNLIILLNGICGMNWSFNWDIVTNEGSTCEMRGYLTIAGVTRSNIGDGDGDNFGGARKKAVANTLVRCAMLFGLGLELWKDPAGSMRRRREWERQQKQTGSPFDSGQAQPAPVKKQQPPAVHDEGAANWTQGNLGTFWGYVKGTLHLTEDEVHMALGVDSVRDYTGAKRDAMETLKAYAAGRDSAALDDALGERSIA